MICCSDSCKTPAGRFTFVMGKMLGLWLLYVGIQKWLGGPAGFVGYIESTFAQTWSPGFLNTILAWIIIVAEPLLGLWLVLCSASSTAWLASTALFFLLTMGQTILGKTDLEKNWMYTILAAVGFALAQGCSTNAAGGCCSEKNTDASCCQKQS